MAKKKYTLREAVKNSKPRAKTFFAHEREHEPIGCAIFTINYIIWSYVLNYYMMQEKLGMYSMHGALDDFMKGFLLIISPVSILCHIPFYLGKFCEWIGGMV